MVGQPGQQRAARYVGDGPDLAVKVAFLAQRPADERHGRVLAAGGEIEQHAVWTEIEIGRHTSELQSLMRISYAVFCLKKKTHQKLYTSDPKHKRQHNGIRT